MASLLQFFSKQKAVELVQCDLEDPDTLPAALGRAAKVVCTVGASESTVDFSAPYKIDKVATENLIQAGKTVVVGCHLSRLASHWCRCSDARYS